MTDRNRRLVLAERPTGMVQERTVRLEEADLPALGDGEALAKVRYLSIDPTIRTWMDDAPGYLPPIAIGEVVRAGGVAEVLSSNNEQYAPGDLLFGLTGWQEYVIADSDAAHDAEAAAWHQRDCRAGGARPQRHHRLLRAARRRRAEGGRRRRDLRCRGRHRLGGWADREAQGRRQGHRHRRRA